MSTLLILSFLLACTVGAIAAWRVSLSDALAMAGTILILCTAGLAAALTVAAESGSPPARYLGLFAILLASTALCGSVTAVRRLDRAKPRTPDA